MHIDAITAAGRSAGGRPVRVADALTFRQAGLGVCCGFVVVLLGVTGAVLVAGTGEVGSVIGVGPGALFSGLLGALLIASLPGAEFALWLQIWVYAPALIFFAVLMPLYFPDGRLPSSR